MHVTYIYCVTAIMRKIIDDTLSQHRERDFIQLSRIDNSQRSRGC